MSAPRETGVAGSGSSGLRVGLDIGGTKVLGVVLDAADAVLAEVRVPTGRGADGVVGSAVEAVEALAAQLGTEVAALAGVGAGLPGLVDPRTGVVSHAVNLGIDEPVDLGALLGARLAVRVVLENDLNVAALGAARHLGLDRGDLAFVALGTGLAAGLVLDGVLRRGLRGAAGEIGHVPYVLDGPVCPCGQRGCLELYASGSAIDAAWSARAGARPSAVPAPAEVFAAAAAGDLDALTIRDRFADAVAAAVRILVLTCDVEHVVLGGGVAEVGAPLVVAVAEALGRQATGSAFLRSLGLADRLRIVQPGALVAPVGAALALGASLSPTLTPVEAVPWKL